MDEPLRATTALSPLSAPLLSSGTIDRRAIGAPCSIYILCNSFSTASLRRRPHPSSTEIRILVGLSQLRSADTPHSSFQPLFIWELHQCSFRGQMISLLWLERQECGLAETQRCLIHQERPSWIAQASSAYFPIEVVLNACGRYHRRLEPIRVELDQSVQRES